MRITVGLEGRASRPAGSGTLAPLGGAGQVLRVVDHDVSFGVSIDEGDRDWWLGWPTVRRPGSGPTTRSQLSLWPRISSATSPSSRAPHHSPASPFDGTHLSAPRRSFAQEPLAK